MDPHHRSFRVFTHHNKGYTYLIKSNTLSNICLKADDTPFCCCLWLEKLPANAPDAFSIPDIVIKTQINTFFCKYF